MTSTTKAYKKPAHYGKQKAKIFESFYDASQKLVYT